MSSVSPAWTLADPESLSTDWDVVVVGGGPAGAVAARALAQRDYRVLLVDKATFPRPKVCGGCLSHNGTELLAALGLLDALNSLGIPRTDRLHLVARGGAARLEIPPGLAVSRSAMDLIVLQQAVEAGVRLACGTTARLTDCHSDLRELSLRQDESQRTISARIVLAADGLNGSLLASQSQADVEVSRDSRIGVGCTLEDHGDFFPPSEITMAYGQGGYLGAVAVEKNRLNLAAALDAGFIREMGGPGAAARSTLHEVGLPSPALLEQAEWTGTPPLTRRRVRLSRQRLFVIGDSAGYIEPFTGEGMTWALLSALAVVPLVQQGIAGWSQELEAQWECRHRQQVRRRQWVCRAVTALLKRPRACGVAVKVLNRFPWLAGPAIQRINRPIALPQDCTLDTHHESTAP